MGCWPGESVSDTVAGGAAALPSGDVGRSDLTSAGSELVKGGGEVLRWRRDGGGAKGGGEW